MQKLHNYMTSKLHHKRLSRSAAALAGLAGAVSILIGLLAARVTPHGWSRLTSALHVTRVPLIVKLAPVVAGIAMTLGATAGLLSFYSWWMERAEQEQPPGP
jgi:hypothetical protein